MSPIPRHCKTPCTGRLQSFILRRSLTVGRPRVTRTSTFEERRILSKLQKPREHDGSSSSAHGRYRRPGVRTAGRSCELKRPCVRAAWIGPSSAYPRSMEWGARKALIASSLLRVTAAGYRLSAVVMTCFVQLTSTTLSQLVCARSWPPKRSDVHTRWQDRVLPCVTSRWRLEGSLVDQRGSSVCRFQRSPRLQLSRACSHCPCTRISSGDFARPSRRRVPKQGPTSGFNHGRCARAWLSSRRKRANGQPVLRPRWSYALRRLPSCMRAGS